MLKAVLKEIFYCLSGALVLFCLLEIFWPRLILAYLNINLVLLFWLFIGIFILASKDKENYE